MRKYSIIRSEIEGRQTRTSQSQVKGILSAINGGMVGHSPRRTFNQE